VADFYRDVVRLLRDNGYEFKRQGPGLIGVRVIVDRKLKSKFTANGILKEAGLPKAF
jgi:hypothetical protein